MKIESGIKIPEYKKKTGTKKYQLERMKVGHSFLYEGSMHGALSLMWQYRKKLGHDYIRSKTKYGNQRIWRVV